MAIEKYLNANSHALILYGLQDDVSVIKRQSNEAWRNFSVTSVKNALCEKFKSDSIKPKEIFLIYNHALIYGREVNVDAKNIVLSDGESLSEYEVQQKNATNVGNFVLQYFLLKKYNPEELLEATITDLQSRKWSRIRNLGGDDKVHLFFRGGGLCKHVKEEVAKSLGVPTCFVHLYQDRYFNKTQLTEPPLMGTRSNLKKNFIKTKKCTPTVCGKVEYRNNCGLIGDGKDLYYSVSKFSYLYCFFVKALRILASFSKK